MYPKNPWLKDMQTIRDIANPPWVREMKAIQEAMKPSWFTEIQEQQNAWQKMFAPPAWLTEMQENQKRIAALLAPSKEVQALMDEFELNRNAIKNAFPASAVPTVVRSTTIEIDDEAEPEDDEPATQPARRIGFAF